MDGSGLAAICCPVTLALSAIPLTAVMSVALYFVSQDAKNSHAFWLGQSSAALILVDLVGLSAILGRRTFKFKGWQR